MFLYGAVIQYRYRISGHIKQESNNMKSLNALTAHAGAAVLAIAVAGYLTGAVNGSELIASIVAAAAGIVGSFVMEG